VRADLPDDANAELECLAASEPPFTHAATPNHLDRYLSMFNRDGADKRDQVFGRWLVGALQNCDFGPRRGFTIAAKRKE
jgi:hypothetical protein